MGALAGLGTALRQLRERRGLTQVDAAPLAKMGQSRISGYEVSEPVAMELDTLERILDGYHASLSDLAEELARVQGAPAGGTNGGGQANVKSPEEVPEWGRILQRLIEHIDERLCVLEAALVADDDEQDGDGEKRRGNGGA